MVWLLSLLVFLSLSQSKMAHYALPMLPPLALLLGPPLARLWSAGWRGEPPTGVRRGVAGLAWILILAGLAALLAPALSPDVDYTQVGAALLIAPLGLTALGLGIFLTRRAGWAPWASPLVALLVLAGLAGLVTSRLEDYRSLKPLVAPLAKNLLPDDVLVSYADYYHGAVFYSGRRVVVARNWGELDFGRRQDPQSAKWFLPDDGAFVRLLQDPEVRVLAVGETQAFLRLKQQTQGVPGLLLFEWQRRGDKSLFSNRPR
jgi:4-amino-4-deoxy-L-arabinose transferase-like glycosyltransferase